MFNYRSHAWIYILIDGSDIVYIGVTQDLKSRIKSHKHKTHTKRSNHKSNRQVHRREI